MTEILAEGRGKFGMLIFILRRVDYERGAKGRNVGLRCQIAEVLPESKSETRMIVFDLSTISTGDAGSGMD